MLSPQPPPEGRKDPIQELVTSLRSWEYHARVLGNVEAGPAADALENLQANLHEYRVSLREANDNRMKMIELAEKLQAEIKAWRERFPTMEYRRIDDLVTLKFQA